MIGFAKEFFPLHPLEHRKRERNTTGFDSYASHFIEKTSAQTSWNFSYARHNTSYASKKNSGFV
jgi:hypothetical protein